MTKISICIPTYNGASYLQECLDSVCEQSLESTEILVVDDCSSDDTCDIVRRYCATDSRIKLIENEKNLGLVGNWNRCIEHSTGEWVKFVFQDDVIEKDCLKNMLAAAKQHEHPIIVCRRDFIFEAGTNPTTKAYYENHLCMDDIFPREQSISADAFCNAVINHIGINFVGEPSTALIHKSVFERIGEFNPDLIMVCDLEFWTRTAVHTGITYIPDTLAHFRVHANSTSADNFSKKTYRTMLDALILLHDYVYMPAYEPLRIAAAKHSPEIDLLKLLEKESKGAKWMAIDALHRSKNPDPTLIKEWELLIQKWPRLNTHLSGQKGNITLRLKNMLSWFTSKQNQ